MTNSIKALVDGGKASAGPPLGPALGPLGVPVNKVIDAINEKTKEFKGMQVPVTVSVNGQDFEIEVGSPPVSALLKKELKLVKGSGTPNSLKVADMLIEQAIKIAKMKQGSISARDLKGCVKTVIGSCVSMGILVEGKDPRETIADINAGMYDEEIRTEKTEVSVEELASMEARKSELAAEAAKSMAAEESKAQEIIDSMPNKDRADIKLALKGANISTAVITKLLPEEVAAAEGEAGADGAAAPAAEGGAPAAEKKDEPKGDKK